MRSDIQPILAQHPGLLHRMRFVSMRFELRSSQQRLQVAVDQGQASAGAVPADGVIADCDFVLQAPQAAWDAFSQPVPAPGYHDLIALIESGHAQFSGEGLAFFRNLFLVKGIVSAVFRGDARW